MYKRYSVDELIKMGFMLKDEPIREMKHGFVIKFGGEYLKEGNGNLTRHRHQRTAIIAMNRYARKFLG